MTIDPRRKTQDSREYSHRVHRGHRERKGTSLGAFEHFALDLWFLFRYFIWSNTKGRKTSSNRPVIIPHLLRILHEIRFTSDLLPRLATRVAEASERRNCLVGIAGLGNGQ